jgi:NADH-quinone oxidoreductase subunit J
MTQWIIFSILSILVIGSSLGVVLHKNPVVAAVFLVMDLFFIAGLYALQEAHFVSGIQVLVYAGAIVVLFLFVIMILNLDPDMKSPFFLKKKPSFYILFFITIVGLFFGSFFLLERVPLLEDSELTQVTDHTLSLGLTLFVKYLWPFELVSILILLSMIAAIVIAKKTKERSF